MGQARIGGVTHSAHAGVVNRDSYRTWGKAGSAAIMRNRVNRSSGRLKGKTSSNECTSDCQCKDSGSQHSAENGILPSVALPTNMPTQ